MKTLKRLKWAPPHVPEERLRLHFFWFSLLWLCSLLATIPGAARATPLAPEGVRGGSTPPSACDGGVTLDDGSLETGYGWIPSAVDGRYGQEFDSTQWDQRGTTEVCVCWTRTNTDDSVDFTVELYRFGADGLPRDMPEYSMTATATGVPEFPEAEFTSVPVPGWPVPPGRFLLAVRWDPSADPFFFVCADQSPETPFVEGWFIDDRASGWSNLSESGDPIFFDHRAMLVRAQPGPAMFPVDVPVGQGWAAAVLILLLTALGVRALVQR